MLKDLIRPYQGKIKTRYHVIVFLCGIGQFIGFGGAILCAFMFLKLWLLLPLLILGGICYSVDHWFNTVYGIGSETEISYDDNT